MKLNRENFRKIIIPMVGAVTLFILDLVLLAVMTRIGPPMFIPPAMVLVSVLVGGLIGWAVGAGWISTSSLLVAFVGLPVLLGYSGTIKPEAVGWLIPAFGYFMINLPGLSFGFFVSDFAVNRKRQEAPNIG